MARRLAAGLLLMSLFSGCSGGAVLVEDPYWAPVLGAEALRKKVRAETGISPAVLHIPPGAPLAELLDDYLRDKAPQQVFLGAFAAADLEGLAERWKETRFFCLDAPSDPPAPSPYVWVRFDPGPALDRAAGRIRKTVEEAGAGKGPTAAFLDRGLGGVFAAAAARAGLELDTVEVLPETGLEELRVQVRGKIAGNPPLVVVLAGPRSAAILDLLLKEKPVPVFLAEAGDLPLLETARVAGVVGKDYAAAVAAALRSGAGRGALIEIPMVLEGKLFDKAN